MSNIKITGLSLDQLKEQNPGMGYIVKGENIFGYLVEEFKTECDQIALSNHAWSPEEYDTTLKFDSLEEQFVAVGADLGIITTSRETHFKLSPLCDGDPGEKYFPASVILYSVIPVESRLKNMD